MYSKREIEILHVDTPSHYVFTKVFYHLSHQIQFIPVGVFCFVLFSVTDEYNISYLAVHLNYSV